MNNIEVIDMSELSQVVGGISVANSASNTLTAEDLLSSGAFDAINGTGIYQGGPTPVRPFPTDVFHAEDLNIGDTRLNLTGGPLNYAA